MLRANKSVFLRWSVIASVIVWIAGTIMPADARRGGGGARSGARGGSVQGRYGASSAGRSSQTSASRSRHSR